MSQQRRYMDNGPTVPYITRWTHEPQVVPELVVRATRKGQWLAYADEGPYDRDHGSALWGRQAVAPGKGSADFTLSGVHREVAGRGPGVRGYRRALAGRRLLSAVKIV